MNYTQANETHTGLHIVFDEPITDQNFPEACRLAICLAKEKCAETNAVAINFFAMGLPVQVVECDNGNATT